MNTHLDNLDYSFDLQKLFERAADTFRIDKYNRNHEEILKELGEFFG